MQQLQRDLYKSTSLSTQQTKFYLRPDQVDRLDELTEDGQRSHYVRLLLDALELQHADDLRYDAVLVAVGVLKEAARTDEAEDLIAELTRAILYDKQAIQVNPETAATEFDPDVLER